MLRCKSRVSSGSFSSVLLSLYTQKINCVPAYIYECVMKIMVYDELDEAFCTGGNAQLESSERISTVNLVCCWS